MFYLDEYSFSLEFGWTQTHGHFALMGGFIYKENKEDPGRPLSPYYLEHLLRSGRIEITKEEIMDKSKQDLLAKSFTMVQIIWFIIQLLARVIEQLPTTQIELATFGYAVLNLVTFFAWWSKPQNVNVPVKVFADKSDQITMGVHPSRRLVSESIPLLPTEARAGDSIHILEEDVDIHDGDLELSQYKMSTSFAIAMVFSTVFGGIHTFGGWRQCFLEDKTLWRVSAVLITALPVCSFAWRLPSDSDQRHWLYKAFNSLGLLLLAVYIVARLILLALMFKLLIQEKPSSGVLCTAKVDWLTYFPHI